MSLLTIEYQYSLVALKLPGDELYFTGVGYYITIGNQFNLLKGCDTDVMVLDFQIIQTLYYAPAFHSRLVDQFHVFR